MKPSKRVLIISYLFPPVGGPGVQRVLKFAKYLPEFGWDPVVLTVKDINYSIYDESLLKDIDPETTVIRTESLDPQRLTRCLFSGTTDGTSGSMVVKNSRFKEGSRSLALYRILRDLFAIPDPAILWAPFAYVAGLRAIRKLNIEAIVALAPPNSSTFVAKLLSKRTGIPCILDFRDPWVDGVASTFATGLHRSLHKWLEGKAINGAAAITVYGEVYERDLRAKYPQFKGIVAELTNGFDRADLDGVVAQSRAENKRRIVYQGSVNWYHRQNFQLFLEALRILPNSVKDTIEVLFVGRVTADVQSLVCDLGLEQQVKFLSYKPHRESLGYLLSADAALLFVEKGDRTSVTGKVFEYLMAGCPILASIEPDGACAEVLHRAGCADWIVAPDEPGAMSRAICSLAASNWPRPSATSIERFSRKSITGDLAVLLDRVTVADEAVMEEAIGSSC